MTIIFDKVNNRVNPKMRTNSDKLSLRWNEFQGNISSSFSSLRNDPSITDVTLISEDDQHIDAHKVMLATSSPFFKNILIITKQQNPVIYLKGFTGNSLNSILDFMYHGEAEIYQEDLDEFFAVAEELQLKDLTGVTNETPFQNQSNDKSDPILIDVQIPRAKTHNSSADNEVEPYYEGEYKVKDTTKALAFNNSAAQVRFNGGSTEDLKSTLWSMISQKETVFTCMVCGKSKDKTLDKDARKHIVSHVESKHTEGVVYDCNKCDKTFGYKNALHKHTHMIHNKC